LFFDHYGEWAFSSAVYISPIRTMMLAAGVLGGVLMWGFINLAIWPSLKIALGRFSGSCSKTGGPPGK
jgi:hypothetical protein